MLMQLFPLLLRVHNHVDTVSYFHMIYSIKKPKRRREIARTSVPNVNLVVSLLQYILAYSINMICLIEEKNMSWKYIEYLLDFLKFSSRWMHSHRMSFPKNMQTNIQRAETTDTALSIKQMEK